jgi:hypothetical protein
MKQHQFQHTDQQTYTDQHGCVGTLNDSRQINGKLYFQWRYKGNKIFEITPSEAQTGFTIEEHE